MKIRQARKILQHPARSKRLRRKLERMYQDYYDEKLALFVTPSWHEYYLFKNAWAVIGRKIRKYGDKFKLL